MNVYPPVRPYPPPSRGLPSARHCLKLGNVFLVNQFAEIRVRLRDVIYQPDRILVFF